jgi:hypothetical protein
VRPEEAFRSWTSRAGTVKVRNVLNPLLWMMALVFPTSALAVYLLRDHAIFAAVFAALAAAPVLVSLLAYRKDATAEIVDIVNEMPRLEIERKRAEDEQ